MQCVRDKSVHKCLLVGDGLTKQKITRLHLSSWGARIVQKIFFLLSQKEIEHLMQTQVIDAVLHYVTEFINISFRKV